MPRVPYAEKGREAAAATPVYEELERDFGVVPNVVKLLGHSGAATEAMGRLLRAYFGELSLSDRTREIAYLTVARANGCAYCQGHHVPIAKKAGVTDAEIELLGEAGVASEALSPSDRAVVRFAHETTRQVTASDDAVEQLRSHFDETQVAEIALVVAAGNFIQRIGRNFGAELEL